MTAARGRPPAHQSSVGRHRRAKRRIITRWWFWTAIGVVLVMLGAGAWVGTRALEAKTHLETAQAQIGKIKEQVTGFDIEAATATFASAAGHTAAARELTTDPLWQIAENVPVLGANLSVFREITETIDDLMADGVSPLLDVATTLNPDALAPKDGAIDLAPLTAAVPVVADSTTAFAAAKERIEALDTGGTISQLGEAKKKFTGLLGSVEPTLEMLNKVLPLAGPLLGSEAPRTYVLMFQNNAELRPLGGAALSFALIGVDNGRIQLLETQSSTFSGFQSTLSSVVPVPDGVGQVYPANTYGSFISNVTLRPSFVDAALQTREHWRLRFGTSVDGVLSIDPVALSYIVGGTGPLTLSTGDVLTPDSLVGLVLNQVYIRYYTGNVVRDNLAADKFFGEAIGATFGALTKGPLVADKLIAGVQRGLDERRLLFWSANEAEQASLAELGLPGEIPISDEEKDQVGVYFQDGVAAKLDYYLIPSVALSSGGCRTDGQRSFRVAVSLQHALDPAAVSSLPPAVVGNWKKEGLAKGRQRLIVLLYAAPGSQIQSVTVNGKPVKFAALHDTIFPVAKAMVEMNPGETGTVVFDYFSPTSAEKPFTAQVTPTAKAVTLSTVPLDCSTVPAG